MRAKQAIAITLAGLLGLSMAVYNADRVQALPLCGPLPTKWYSGYLPVSDTKSLHYVYVESAGNVTTDPVVIWLNGGPGCSSMLGAFSENGPFIFDDGEAIIKPNPHSWNQRANLLYIESPAHVGFSIGGPGDWNFTDMTQAADLFSAVQQFYVKFAERLPNPLWISGESYAGIYGPFLAWKMHSWNNEAAWNNGTLYNLKGFAIGNGITDWHYDAQPATYEAFREFNLIPPELLDLFKQFNCTYDVATNPVNDPRCEQFEDRVNLLIGGLNPYDVYRTTYGLGSTATQQTKRNLAETHGESVVNGEVKRYQRGVRLEQYTPWLKTHLLFKEAASKISFGDPMADYLNRADVRAALNIPQSVQAWEGCTTNPLFNYPFTREASIWIYTILQRYNYTLMHYSGDTDGVVPTVGTRRWIESLQWPVTSAWQPWTTDGQVSGYSVTYANNFYFTTIHGVGHMAPQWKRKDMQLMILKFFHGEDFITN